jgi:hypothetical protein
VALDALPATRKANVPQVWEALCQLAHVHLPFLADRTGQRCRIAGSTGVAEESA